MVEYFLRLSFLQCIMQIGNFSLLLPPPPPLYIPVVFITQT